MIRKMTRDPGKAPILRDWGEENEQGSKTYFTGGELIAHDVLRAKELMSSRRQV